MSNLSSLSPVLKQRFFDANGAPLAGGYLYTYVAGSATPLATYTDSTHSSANLNPVHLDANGEADVWLDDVSIYKFILTDSSLATQWTIDNVKGLGKAIADQINIAGALAVINNLSDLNSVPTALVNLGIAPFQYQKSHAITNNQAATNLTNETFDGTAYTSVIYNYEIVQGTTIQATGDFSVHYLNGTWVFCDGMGRGSAHGVTFSLSQSTTIGQLKAAESGLGDGTVKLKRHFFFA